MRKDIYEKFAMMFIFLVLIIANSNSANADMASVSQLGYHPNSAKQVVLYTSATSGTFTINDANSNSVVATK